MNLKSFSYIFMMGYIMSWSLDKFFCIECGICINLSGWFGRRANVLNNKWVQGKRGCWIRSILQLSNLGIIFEVLYIFEKIELDNGREGVCNTL
jgi:hypothetical protein